jgi:large subunit ribosomal protein L31
MKKDIHPQYNTMTVTCTSCGNTFTSGSILDEITTEVCSNCHPFYTGEKRIVDSDNLVAKFEKKKEAASKSSFRTKKEKMAARKMKQDKIQEAPKKGLTLKDMLSDISAN